MKLWHLLVISITLTSCGGDDGGSGAGSGGGGASSSEISGIQIQVGSDEVSTLSTVTPLAVACSMSVGGVTHNGQCETPVSLKAKVFRINLNNSFGGPPSRLIDFTAAAEDEPFGGPHGVLGLASYDFAASATSTNPYSDDNLQDGGSAYFNSVDLRMGAVEMKYEIPAGNVNVTDNFWTIRYMLLPQNPLDDSAIDACVTSAPTRTTIQDGGDLYAAPNGFLQGDILVCQKNLTSDTCADGDFQWIDSGTGALSATRPASPVRMAGTHAFQDNSCQDEGGNLVMGGSSFRTELASAIRINKSRSAEDCMFKYDFQTSCTTTGETSGSCSDTTQEGFGINVSIDFDLDNAIFVENTVDLTSDTEAVIRQNLDKMLPKPLYVDNNKAAVGTGDNTGLGASLTITINNDVATQALTDRGEDPTKYDSNFCFIPQETGGE